MAYAKDIIIYPWFDEGKFKEDAYYLALLTLALEHSKSEFGEYELKKAVQPMFQERAILEVENNKNLSVVWTMTSELREQKLNPVRIPILRGLGGYRIFLIKEKQQEKFYNITSKQQLQELYAGQGHDWPDSAILSDNSYHLVTGPGHKILFNMLQYGRFDYMPRALHEAWNEAKIFDGLEVELSIALHYPSPYYFFVSNDNPILSKRIELGLIKAEKEGRFQHLFNTHAITQNMLTSAKLHERKVFHLKNSFLSKESQKVVDKTELFHYKNRH
jgi:hypothetical protein